MTSDLWGGLLVKAGSWTCALPLSRVVETMRALPRNPCADVAEFVLGVSVIRGSATAVLDLGRLLGSQSSDEVSRYVVAEIGDTTVALAVQTVVGIRWLHAEEVWPLSGVLEEFAGRGVGGLSVVEGELVALLSESAVLAPTVSDVLAQPESDP